MWTNLPQPQLETFLPYFTPYVPPHYCFVFTESDFSLKTQRHVNSRQISMARHPLLSEISSQGLSSSDQHPKDNIHCWCVLMAAHQVSSQTCAFRTCERWSAFENKNGLTPFIKTQLQAGHMLLFSVPKDDGDGLTMWGGWVGPKGEPEGL